jgi:hypothetical protein
MIRFYSEKVLSRSVRGRQSLVAFGGLAKEVIFKFEVEVLPVTGGQQATV